MNLEFHGSLNLRDFILGKILDNPVHPIEPALKGLGTVSAMSDDRSAILIKSGQNTPPVRAGMKALVPKARKIRLKEP